MQCSQKLKKMLLKLEFENLRNPNVQIFEIHIDGSEGEIQICKF